MGRPTTTSCTKPTSRLPVLWASATIGELKAAQAKRDRRGRGAERQWPLVARDEAAVRGGAAGVGLRIRTT
eukprot:6301371-Pyramimonas_sp.AAC.1